MILNERFILFHFISYGQLSYIFISFHFNSFRNNQNILLYNNNSYIIIIIIIIIIMVYNGKFEDKIIFVQLKFYIRTIRGDIPF